jgi:amino acid transporter
MAIVVSLYLMLNIALIGSVGSAALAASPAPIAAASGMIFAHSGTVVACIGIVAMLSALNAYIVATSRVLQSAAVQVSLPKIQDLTRQGTPAYALVLGSGMSAGLLLFSNHFEILATISVITTLIPYIFFCLAAWILVTDIKSRIISGMGAVSTALILIIYFVV